MRASLFFAVLFLVSTLQAAVEGELEISDAAYSGDITIDGSSVKGVHFTGASTASGQVQATESGWFNAGGDVLVSGGMNISSGKVLTFNSTIQGTPGTGMVTLTGNNSSSAGAITIDAGTVKGVIPQGSSSDTYKPLGTGTVTINQNGKLLWTNTATSKTGGDSGGDITNTITGTGTLRLEIGKTYGNSSYGLNTKLSDFTGTLELANFTRLYWNGSTTELNKVGTIIVESGAELWPGATLTFDSNLILNGNGAGSGGDGSGRGAIRLDGDCTFNGTVTLASNALIGLGSAHDSTFANGIDLAGHQLTFQNTVSNNGGNISIKGNVTAGTVVDANTQFVLTFDGSNAGQTIDAAIIQNNTHDGRAMVIKVGDGLTTYTNGVISGAGDITKTGAGTLQIGAANTNNGKFTISEGTVVVPAGADQTSTTASRQYVAGQGTLEVVDGARFVWNNQYSNDSMLFTAISGEGTISVSAEHNRGNNYGGNYGLNNNTLQNFTGTIELNAHARWIGSSLGKTSKVIVANGGMFWANGGTHAEEFFISGNGAGAGGDGTGRGAIGVSNTCTFTGKITLNANAEFGVRDANPVANIQSEIETNGYMLSLSQNYNSGGKINLTGNVSSTGDTLGTLSFTNRSNAYTATIGDSSAAASATTQSIAANVDVAATNPTTFTFQPGENRTIEITGQLTGNHAITKTGAGTLNLLGGAPISGAFDVQGGTVTVGPLEGTDNTSSGITALTVTNGATVNLNTPNKSLSTLTVSDGTVNANFGFVDYNIGPCIAANCLITVGSADGGTGYLKLARKACSDHGNNVTIYDGSTIEMAGGDISFANSHLVTFVGGGSITSGASNAYFNFRGNGNQSFVVQGADAHALIDCNITLYDGGFGSVNVIEADSSLRIAKNVSNGMANNIGFHKVGQGTLILEGTNRYPRLQIDEGTVEFAGNGSLETSAASLPLTVSVADGAKLILGTSENLSDAGTFTMAPGASLIVNAENWQLSNQVNEALVPGTLLGGSGTIVGDLTKTGITVSPGDDSVATLTINGNLNLSGSNVLLDVAGPTSYDVLKITGTSDVSDSVFFFSGTPDQTPLAFGDTLKFLETSNSTDEPIFQASNIRFDYDGGILGLKYEDGGWMLFATDGASVPEPGTWVMLLLGLTGFAFLRRK
ncbi:MAG: PEP-CTERM sorting domain-containing protein [Thermoguttaceae bacterium]|nr:PEP-CTERM sorting domain-containing protein [Thermoguttaceae bacterium]